MRLPSRPPGPSACLPVAGFGCNPSEPAAAELIRFFDYSYDPGHRGIVGWHWTFGDGTASDERQPTHRYGDDGDYAVELTVRTPDGREGTATRAVEVRTHEVAIESLRGPSSCRVGETVDVVVDVSSGRYDEVVDLRLFIRLPGAEPLAEETDRTAFAVRAGGARNATSTVLRAAIPAAAAASGSVTIKAVVVVLGVLDPMRRDHSWEISIPVVRRARG